MTYVKTMSKLTVRLSNMAKVFTQHLTNESLRSFGGNFLRLQLLTLIKSMTNFTTIDSSDQDKFAKYWSGHTTNQIIQTADELYQRGKFLEVYEILNRLKYCNQLAVKWRIARALFKMTCQIKVENDDFKREMINEAYEIITTAVSHPEIGEIDTTVAATVYKWAAIIVDRKFGIDGLDKRVKNSEIVKSYLIKACELDPNDVTTQYLLGRWCYEMSNITWFQRIVSKMLYSQAPQSSFEEAHQYLARAEDLQPKFYLQNTYLLGKTCMKLGQFYKAKYYFEVVENLQVHNDHEEQCVKDARKMLKRLDKFSLEKNVLLNEYPFGNNDE